MNYEAANKLISLADLVQTILINLTRYSLNKRKLDRVILQVYYQTF